MIKRSVPAVEVLIVMFFQQIRTIRGRGERRATARLRAEWYHFNAATVPGIVQSPRETGVLPQ